MSNALPLKPVRSGRWLFFLSVVVLLHWWLFRWALTPFIPSLPAQAGQLIQADLQWQALNPPPRPAISEHTSPRPPAVTEPADEGAGDGAEATPSAPADTAPPKAEAVPGPDAASPTPITLGPLPHYAIDAPPSAGLTYDVHSRRKAQDIYGSGRIRWQSDGAAYRVEGDFNVLFLTLLNFRSEGRIDPATGVSPTLYAEKRARRSETNTHFQRERNVISFSASTAQYERPGGEQDRASVVWQLSGIGRRQGQQFAPGGTLTMAVAGVRHADVWAFRIVGREEIGTSLGKVSAWRLARSARKDSYEQSLDVWLSPQHEWYPVKLRYTSANGDFLDLSVAGIERSPGR